MAEIVLRRVGIHRVGQNVRIQYARPFEQCVHGNTLPPGLTRQSYFDFMGNLDTHRAAPFSGYRVG